MSGSEAWEKAYEEGTKRESSFESLSGEPVAPLGYPAEEDPPERIGYPGAFPYTRGIHATGYRGRLWTIRQFAGFASVQDTNARFRHLLKEGQHGVSVAFDMPTLMGLDSDSERALGEVGHCGVAVDSADDMGQLMDQIPLDQVSVSMTINGPAQILFAFLLVAAEDQGVDWKSLQGTLQNDILKEYIAQKEWLFPPEPHLRLLVDQIEFCNEHVPEWNTISISGYHIREAGATAIEELAFTLADGFAYVEAGIDRGLAVDSFVPRFSFFFDAHVDFFEEIAKFRAARRIWARWMRDRYGATDERSLKLRFHTQTSGVSLTAQLPYNNVVRTAIEALSAVLGGTQSLHTNALDEVYALPTAEAAELALRTQQVIATETGAADTIDPLGGSWYVEQLTDQIEAAAEEIFATIDRKGSGSMLAGVLAGIEEGWFQGRLSDSAYEFEKKVTSGERGIVGVNRYVKEDENEIQILRISEEIEATQRQVLGALRSTRDEAAVTASLAALVEGAAGE
ncbi:MAG: methylmalonyl-CoA mutase family protein, partial [Acidimicrobiia bacterium]|nr:methylmalonyl-CoA mutase family protein [Acidimicrobiia bacterium]